MAAAPTLTYGRQHLWRWRRWAAIAVAMASLGSAAVRWGPTVLARGRHLYWQWRSAAFTAPPGTVAFELDSGSADLQPRADPPAAQLLRQPGYVPLDARWVKAQNFPFGITAVYQLFPWDRYEPPPSSPTFQDWPDPTVFCHERTARCGRRLVRVGCGLCGYGGTGIGDSWQVDVILHADAWMPATPARRATLGPIGPHSELDRYYLGRGRFRVDIGQIDPADIAQFTIDAVDDHGVRHMIVGRLNDDGTVSLLDPARDDGGSGCR